MKQYIERESAIGAIDKALKKVFVLPVGKSIIDRVPAADVREVVRGKWMWELADNGWANHICSVCGYTKNTDIHVRMDYNFCPNCGAEMR